MSIKIAPLLIPRLRKLPLIKKGQGWIPTFRIIMRKILMSIDPAQRFILLFLIVCFVGTVLLGTG